MSTLVMEYDLCWILKIREGDDDSESFFAGVNSVVVCLIRWWSSSPSHPSPALIRSSIGVSTSHTTTIPKLGFHRKIIHDRDSSAAYEKEIDVTRCDRVSLSSLISVVKGHPTIQHLKASHCVSEIFESFLQHIKALKHLKTIWIDGARVSDLALETLISSCRSLAEIRLSICVDVTNIGMMGLARNCLNLKTLNLGCCGFVTDVAISVVARSCRNLETLKLESCHMIIEKGLQSLGCYSKLLQELDLTDCYGVNDRAVVVLEMTVYQLYPKVARA